MQAVYGMRWRGRLPLVAVPIAIIIVCAFCGIPDVSSIEIAIRGCIGRWTHNIEYIAEQLRIRGCKAKGRHPCRYCICCRRKRKASCPGGKKKGKRGRKEVRFEDDQQGDFEQT